MKAHIGKKLHEAPTKGMSMNLRPDLKSFRKIGKSKKGM